MSLTHDALAIEFFRTKIKIGQEYGRGIAHGARGHRCFGSPGRITRISIAALPVACVRLARLALLAGLAVACLLQPASAAPGSTFDHFSTGFELLGVHRDVPCESCHVGAIFKGTPHDCASCHSPGSRFGATAKPTTHIVSNSDCAQCHTPFGWRPVAKFNHLNVFGTCSTCHNTVQAAGKPANHVPTTAECNSCHSVTQPWSVLQYPSNHIPVSPTALCTDCHTGSSFSVVPSLTNIHRYAPSTTGNCAQCHGPTTAPTFAIPAIGFSIVTMPANHVPTAAACESCHVGANSSIAALPVIDGAKFTNSAMSHAGITTCVACHGPTVTSTSFYGITKIIVMPPSTTQGPNSHIPSSTACESCHLGSMPSGLVAGNAASSVPGSLFANPPPTTAQIHAGVSGNCASCHEGAYTWVDAVSKYPLNPAAFSASTLQYFGFQTRPGKTASATNVVDAAHPTTGDCSTCHTRTDYFEGQIKPANHIPTAPAAACSACHKGTDFSVLPALADIHANAPSTTGNCAQCHGPTTAPTFAIPTANFSIVTEPANHVPTTAACEGCHVGAGSSIAATPVPNGAKFTNSAMNHAGITTCVACHGPTVTATSFFGITKIIVMPATSPVGPASHLPSGTTCESCHLASMPAGLVPGNATATVPGSRFATPAPTTAQIHAGITANCATCHEGAYNWVDMASQYPLNPATFSAATLQYFGFQTRPGKAASTTNILDAAHPASGDCSTCHTRTDYFEGNLKPSNHIPTAATAACSACHKTGDFSVLPALADIHANAPSTTSNCAQCHGPTTAPTFAIPAANFSIVTEPANHVPTTAACESCHVGAGSSIAATPVPNGAKFTNSAMNHAGLTTCVTCHGPTVTNSSFYGVTNIIVMPASSPTGANAHIPSATTCESCHLASMPAGLVPAVATRTVPGTLFETPAPTTAQIHAGITANCASCHEGANNWLDMVAQYPLNPAAFSSATLQYYGFQTRPGKTASATNLIDSAHPTSGDCSSCHSRTDYFEGNLKPSNHIPTAATATCTNCHKSGDFSIVPALVDIHTYAPSTTTNCAQCHGPTTAPTFAIPAANFSIVTEPGNHIPTTAACESCHVGPASSVAVTPVPNGSKFANSAMNHAGITTCATCHGPTITSASFAGVTKIIVMPPSSPAGANSHIPSVTTCETCHLASMPTGEIPAVATKSVPGSGFATPAPTTALIHTGITTNCASCHEGGNQWLDMATYYAISPAVLTSGAQYTGFQTRPGPTAGTFIVADPAHPASGDCSTCHTRTDYFDGNIKPSNHIPTSATAACTDCHKNPNFAVMPALIDIHTNAPSTTTNCTQCHGPTTAPTFAIPSASFSIATEPANHVPTTASCEACHVGAGSSVAATPVPNGAKFANSAMSHAGITTCVSCHGPTITGTSFYGISRIVVMPATTPMGASSHLPTATTCETCHLASMPATFVPANATLSPPGTAFATPPPATAVIHTGVSSGCTNCHEANYVWLDVSKYPIAPASIVSGAQYTGFQTRPTAAGGTYAVADAAHPATGDCVTCHGANFSYFSAQAEPPNHIPTLPNAPCATCHTTSGNFAVYTSDLTALHSEVPTTCSTCHADGKGPFAGATGFTIVQMSTRGRHIPITEAGVAVECSGCHKSVTAFSGTIMSHMAIGDSATSAAGNACDACHEYGFRSEFYGVNINFTRDSPTHHICGAPGTPTAPNVTICATNGGSDCLVGCHQHNNIPSTYKTRPPAVKGAPGAAPAASPAPAAAATAAGGLRFDHTSIRARCATCHDGTHAVAKPPVHLLSGSDCDSCHTTSAWKPAVVDHRSMMAGGCASCHNAVQAVGRPAQHVLTTQSCDSCHYTLAWKPVKPANRPKLPVNRTPARPATPTRPTLPSPASPT